MSVAIERSRVLGPVAGAPLSDAKKAKLADAARQFEASMLTEMLKPLQFGGSADAGGQESEGGASDTIRGLGTDALGKALALHGGLGVARQIIKDVTAEHQIIDTRRGVLKSNDAKPIH